MYDKMLVFLSLVLSIQLAESCKKTVQPILRRTDLEDCTKTFTNRIASFESGYYPGQWMRPVPESGIHSTSTSIATVKADKTYQWFLHDSGSGKVYMEAKKSGWENYFYDHSDAVKHQQSTKLPQLIRDTNLYDGSNESKEIEIWCTSCTPERDSLTYSDCQIVTNRAKQEKLGIMGWYGTTKYSRGSSDNFKWRILSPQTRQYWETVVAADNCAGLDGLPASYTVTSSITRTESTTQTTEVSARISFGREAAKVLQLLGGEAGITQTWSSTSTTEAAEGRSMTLGAGDQGKIIKPGHKWIVKQFVGEVGYTKIKTLKHTSEDLKCT